MPYGILMFCSVPSVMREEPTPSLNPPHDAGLIGDSAKGREFWILRTP